MKIDTSIIDALATNIMVADKDLNILHMNPAVLALMREAESDLRKELPHFSADELIGRNIDVFHKSPQHQRRLLAQLTERYSTTIRVGERAFDLRVSPVEIGYVVEWHDALPRLRNLDYEAQITAIGRSQPIIEFGLDQRITKVNDTFLQVVGYEREEVIGKQYSWFLDKEVGVSSDYEALWRRLNDGQFSGGEYKLNCKNGRTAWLEASFNPIIDHQGRITKFVAFAMDITQQIQLLTDLKILIDENFGELDGLLDGLNNGASHAASAAQETSGAVATVAAAAVATTASSPVTGMAVSIAIAGVPATTAIPSVAMTSSSVFSPALPNGWFRPTGSPRPCAPMPKRSTVRTVNAGRRRSLTARRWRRSNAASPVSSRRSRMACISRP